MYSVEEIYSNIAEGKVITQMNCSENNDEMEYGGSLEIQWDNETEYGLYSIIACICAQKGHCKVINKLCQMIYNDLKSN